MNSDIPVKNIYYMLAYAFRVLIPQGVQSVGTEEFENVAELCAEILIRGMSVQIKRGLKYEYILREEPLSTPRGKLNISDSLKTMSIRRRQLVCSYDEFSVDTYKNRIIKSTMLLFLQSDISESRKKKIRKLLLYLDDIGTLDVHHINWKQQFDRSDQMYRMLIAICNFVIKGLLQTESSGRTRLMSFLDDQERWQLYQAFVKEYYRKEHPKLKVEAAEIKWAVDDNDDEMLPDMITDITLSYQNTWLIIDTKRYSQTTRSKAGGSPKQISDNLYQIFSYVKNKEALLCDTPHTVSGMLLYIRTNEEVLPDHPYHMSGNRIDVKSLDLNCDFSHIREQLDSIVEEFFEV